MIPKFRAWDKRRKGMVEVTSISFRDGTIQEDTRYAVNRKIYLDHVVLMQYTGLKDKNGVEVYFNDVVEDEYGHRYEVVFEGDCLRCNGIRRIRGGHKPKNRWFGIDLKIIGNRCENPELLEELEE